MTTHGELALLAAIDCGQPVPTNSAQAAELKAAQDLELGNGARHAAKVRERITVTGAGPYEIRFPNEEPMNAIYLDASIVEMMLNYARSLGRVEVRMEALADADRAVLESIGGGK